jgi:5-methylcytosine-specific restriction endonuclease McrA
MAQNNLNYFSEEHKRKISEALKGRKVSEETRQKLSHARKGKIFGPLSEEHREHIRIANIGRKHSEDTKAKISKSLAGKPGTWNGRHHTGGAKAKIGKAQIGNKNCVGRVLSEETKGKIAVAHTGLTCSKETKLKMSQAGKGRKFSDEHKRKIGETRQLDKHPLWNGGSSFEPYPPTWTISLKKIIRERDKHECQVCGNPGKTVHHIDYDKENCNPNNLITLCRSCHAKTNCNRKQWTLYFKNRKENYDYPRENISNCTIRTGDATDRIHGSEPLLRTQSSC